MKIVIHKSHSQNFQLRQSLERLLVQAHDLVVVQLQAAQRRGAAEHLPADGGECIVRQITASDYFVPSTVEEEVCACVSKAVVSVYATHKLYNI